MNSLSKKKPTFINFMGLLGSIVYGYFVVLSLQRLYFLDSGDINELVDFFDEATLEALELYGWTLFRYGILLFVEFFQSEVIVILSYVAFITSSITFYICLKNTRSSKHLIYILPLLLMVFLSPNVVNLFASGIRSGIAFIFLLIAITIRSTLIRFILLGLSSAIHLSMIPIISFYFLFHILHDRRINASSLFCFFLLPVYSFAVTYFAYAYQYNITSVNSSIYFNFLTFYLALMLLFISKKSINNLYGFMSIGIILIVLAGNLLDISFSRYIGNALILYLFFLVKEGHPDTIKVFSLGYAPIFALTLFFTYFN